MRQTLEITIVITILILVVQAQTLSSIEPHRPLPNSPKRFDVFVLLNTYMNIFSLIISNNTAEAKEYVDLIENLYLPEAIEKDSKKMNTLITSLINYYDKIINSKDNSSLFILPKILRTIDEIQNKWIIITAISTKFVSTEYLDKVRSIEVTVYHYLKHFKKTVQSKVLELLYSSNIGSTDNALSINVDNEKPITPSENISITITINRSITNIELPVSILVILANSQYNLFEEVGNYLLENNDTSLTINTSIPFEFYFEAHGNPIDSVDIFIVLLNPPKYCITRKTLALSYEYSMLYVIAPKIFYKGIKNTIKAYISPINIKRSGKIFIDNILVKNITIDRSPYEIAIEIPENISVGYHRMIVKIDASGKYIPLEYEFNIIVSFKSFSYDITIYNIEIYPFIKPHLTISIDNISSIGPFIVDIVSKDFNYSTIVKNSPYFIDIDMGSFPLLDIRLINVTLTPSNLSYSMVYREFIIYRVNIVSVIIVIAYVSIISIIARRIHK